MSFSGTLPGIRASFTGARGKSVGLKRLYCATLVATSLAKSRHPDENRERAQ